MNINYKAAINFLKQEIKAQSHNNRKSKYEFTNAQRWASKLFTQNGFNAYGWTWGKYTNENGKTISSYTGTDKAPLFKYNQETDESYKFRSELWLEYIKNTGYTALPSIYYDKNLDSTVLHILYNQLRNKKPHTTKDDAYVNSRLYKELLQRVELQFQLQEDSQEVNHVSE